MDSELIFGGDLGNVFATEADQTIAVTEGENIINVVMIIIVHNYI